MAEAKEIQAIPMEIISDIIRRVKTLEGKTDKIEGKISLLEREIEDIKGKISENDLKNKLEESLKKI